MNPGAVRPKALSRRPGRKTRSAAEREGPTPPGWIDIEVQAPKQECLDDIEEFEIEGAPFELRKKMEDMAQQQGSGHP